MLIIIVASCPVFIGRMMTIPTRITAKYETIALIANLAISSALVLPKETASNNPPTPTAIKGTLGESKVVTLVFSNGIETNPPKK